MHSTDGLGQGTIDRLSKSGEVGVHTLIMRDGTVHHLVSEADSAWHAGKDRFGGNGNPYTIGVEQEHIDGQQNWPDAQIRAAAKYDAGVLRRNPQLTIDDIIGHNDLAGERKQDPVDYPWEKLRRYVNAYLGGGVEPRETAQVAKAPSKIQTFDDYSATTQATRINEKGEIELAPISVEGTRDVTKRARPAGQLDTGFYQDEAPKSFVYGNATVFGDEADRQKYAAAKAAGLSDAQARQVGDNGQGAANLGGLYTPDTYGIAVPQEALIAQLGNNPATWRKARIDIVDPSTGKRLRVPIVDIGPGPGPQSAGVAADFTPNLAGILGSGKNFAFKIVPNAGPDVNKDPQLWGSEQSAIAQGIDSSALEKGRQIIGGKQISSRALSDDEIAQVEKNKAQAIAQQSDIITKLPESDSGNVIGLYKRLDQKVDGVSDQMRRKFQNQLKPQIIGLMREKFPEIKTNDEAWNKALSDVGALDVGREWATKALGYAQQFTNVMQKGVAGSDQLHVNQFLETALPGATEADKHAYLSRLYAMPPDQRIAEVASHLPQPQAGIPSTDPQQIVSALDRLSDPNFQKKQEAELARAKAEMERNISSDPRLSGTTMETIVDATAQMPAFIAAFSNPVMMPVAMAQVSDQVREGFRKEHPEWDEKTRPECIRHFGAVLWAGSGHENHDCWWRGVASRS